MVATRRSHVVRVHDDVNGTGQYVDVEVLDAISFRVGNGKEVILDFPTEKAVPFIVDDTGDGSDQSPPASAATRRSHMKRITGKDDPSQFFDAEVLDAAAFNSANGEEWILSFPAEAASTFDATDNAADAGQPTRRTHTEKVSSTGATANPGAYISVQRCDMLAFRKVNGEEVIISMPSGDDPSNTQYPRAETVITPDGYDPTDATADPPPDNKDPHVYVKFVKDSAGLATQDVKVAMGPLWWIRKISSGGIIFVQVNYSLSANGTSPPDRPTVALTGIPYVPSVAPADVMVKVDKTIGGAVPIAVVNPVTDKMLDTFLQWTPAPLADNTGTTGAAGATLIWYVDGSNSSTDLITPFPTPQNYNLQTYFVPGASFPLILTTDKPTQPGNFLVGADVLQVRQPSLEGGTAPNIIANDNQYLTAADAAAAAAFINSLPLNGDNPGLFNGSGKAAFVGGPLNIGAGGTPRSTRFGSAVFELNYNQLKSAWAAKDAAAQATTPSPVTFTVTVKMPGGTTDQSVGINAQGYLALRDFSLDGTNSPTFKPWLDPAIPDSVGAALSADGSLIGTITPDKANPKFLKVTFATA